MLNIIKSLWKLIRPEPYPMHVLFIKRPRAVGLNGLSYGIKGEDIARQINVAILDDCEKDA